MDTNVLFTIIGAILCIPAFFLLIFLLSALLIKRVGPNQAMVIYGAGGTKVIVGGSHTILPRFQKVKYFSLELMSFPLDLVQELYLSEQKMAVRVEAIALVKVGMREQDVSQVIEQLQNKEQLTREGLLGAMSANTYQQSILKAVELFLDKSQSEREELIRIVIEGHLRGIIGQRTFEELVRGFEEVTEEVFKTTVADFDRMGLELVSFTVKGIQRQFNEASEAMNREYR